MKPLHDAAARERIRNDLTSTLIVEAAAGTGKTTALVDRVLSLIASGKTNLARIVAVTFTEKAAGEMKLRLRTEIDRARRDETRSATEKGRLDRAVEELEDAHIGTIHAFCADLLRTRPVEAEVDPRFTVMAEDEQARLFSDCFDRFFERELANPSDGVARVLRRRSKDRERLSPRSMLERAGRTLLEQRDFATPWRIDRSFDRAKSADAIVKRLHELGSYFESCSDPGDWFAKSLEKVARFSGELARKEQMRNERDYDGLEASLKELAKDRAWGWKGRPGKWLDSAGTISSATVKAMRDEVHAELVAAVANAEADLAAALHRDLMPLVESFEATKRAAGALDFLDLMLRVKALLENHPKVRGELGERFTHILVDEFQDTDPLQAAILLMLTSEPTNSAPYPAPLPGKLFIVGDPKQSIYRFRRADVSLYETIKRELVGKGAEVLHLSTSFRSAPSIQSFVNTVFAKHMVGNDAGSQADYVPLAPFCPEPQGQPTLVGLPVPAPYSDYGKVTNFKIDDSLPDAVGAFVDFLINRSGYRVHERGHEESVPISSRHICLLFKRFRSGSNDITRGYVRALEARRIPHVLVGGRSFHDREEVAAIRTTLRAIEWPDDELSVYATLRGPFVALSDEALLAYRHKMKSLHPLRPVNAEELTDLTRPVQEALNLLRLLHSKRNQKAIVNTLSEFLDATRAHAGIAIWPSGEQALGNILRILDRARRFDASNASSFRGFIERLEEEAERGGASEAPVVEEGSDGVRIMSVHRSKGLEFPIVILVDPTAPKTGREPSRYIDPKTKLFASPLCGCAPRELLERTEEILKHDEEEALRLLYVATTRAREMLVVPVVGDEEVEGWLDPLHAALYPKDRRASKPFTDGLLFGDDSVLVRTDKAWGRGRESSVKPGVVTPREGMHTVVWWCPKALGVGKEDVAGLRQQKILSADTGGVAQEGIARHEMWQSTLTATRAAASEPSLRVRTVTEAKSESTLLANLGVAVESVRTAGRVHLGKRFGTLVHDLLATLPLDSKPKEIDQAANVRGRILGATKEEMDHAVSAVAAALAHPMMKKARAAKEIRRECGISLRAETGELIEGVIDMAFSDAKTGEWTVVDYKTDADPTARQAEYEMQLHLYRSAIESATGEKVHAVLLIV